MKKVLFSLFILSVVLVACEKTDLEVPIKNATYDVTVTAQWTASNHPTDFPSNPHFSPIIGMSHNSNTHIYQVGELASAGVKNMAETGGVSPLDSEIQSDIDRGNAGAMLRGGGIPSGTESSSAAVFVSSSHPLVSVVSMIAPSPDWFIGVNSINLIRTDGSFIEDTTIYMNSYDAGTDDGLTFTSGNAPSNPFIPVHLITDPPLGDSTKVSPAMAYVRFIKRD